MRTVQLGTLNALVRHVITQALTAASENAPDYNRRRKIQAKALQL